MLIFIIVELWYPFYLFFIIEVSFISFSLFFSFIIIIIIIISLTPYVFFNGISQTEMPTRVFFRRCFHERFSDKRNARRHNKTEICWKEDGTDGRQEESLSQK